MSGANSDGKNTPRKGLPGMPFCESTMLRETAERAIRWLEDLPSRRVGAWASAEEIRKALGGTLNEEGMAPSDVVAAFSEGAASGLTGSPGPRYFGFVTGGALPASLAADWLASAWDQNAVLAVSSPAASAAEEIVSEWIIDLLGLPPESSPASSRGADGQLHLPGRRAARGPQALRP